MLNSMCLCSCSRRKARSRRIFMMARLRRFVRRRVTSLFSSMSLMRRRSSMHFR
jgi:hypothetical protein